MGYSKRDVGWGTRTGSHPILGDCSLLHMRMLRTGPASAGVRCRRHYIRQLAEFYRASSFVPGLAVADGRQDLGKALSEIPLNLFLLSLYWRRCH